MANFKTGRGQETGQVFNRNGQSLKKVRQNSKLMAKAKPIEQTREPLFDKLRAERRAGEMLAEVERSPGERTDLTSDQDGLRFTNYEQTLKQNELSPTTAKRWQTEASVPVNTARLYLA